MMSPVSDFEIIEKDGVELYYIIRAEFARDTTTSLAPADYKQQVGFIAYPGGGEVHRHLNLPLERHLVGVLGALRAQGSLRAGRVRRGERSCG
jgi:hypothetical protein